MNSSTRNLDNNSILLLMTLSHRPMHRQEICDILEWPRTTMYDRGVKLIGKDLLCKNPRQDKKQGRDYVYWELTEDGNLFIDRLRGSTDFEGFRRLLTEDIE